MRAIKTPSKDLNSEDVSICMLYSIHDLPASYNASFIPPSYLFNQVASARRCVLRDATIG